MQVIKAGTYAKLECSNCHSILRINAGMRGVLLIAPIFVSYILIMANQDAGIVNDALLMAIGSGISWALIARNMTFSVLKSGEY